MISGFVSANREVIFEIEVSNSSSGATAIVDAVVDTGFNGCLTLTPDIIKALGLTPMGEQPLTLADGVEHSFRSFLASISWHGQLRSIMAVEMPDAPLMGMSLLWGSRLIADIADGGDAVILPLER